MKLYIDGWRKDNDFHSRWVGRHVDVTHVTARLEIGKLSMSLHTDFEEVKWLPTRGLHLLYKGEFYHRRTLDMGAVTKAELAPTTELTPAMWKQTMCWFYGGRLFAPGWRPEGCVKNVRMVADFYGCTLPDTAYTDVLFNG